MAPPLTPHPLVETSLKLDLAEEAIRRVVARPGRGVISWGDDAAPIAVIGYDWNGACLHLSFAAQGRQRRQQIRTLRTRPNYGGARLWWICPVLGTPVRALLLPPGAGEWASRVAHRAAYASQRARLGHDLFSRGLNAVLAHDRWEDARARRNAIRRLQRRQRKRTVVG